MDKKISSDFIWGVNNIAHQTEGNNYDSNWYRWEKRGLVPASGRANDYWHNFREANFLLEDLGVDAFRLSLEWSRIEPIEGKFNQEAIDHYREILKDIKKRNIKIVVGLWHWSVPNWFEEKYGMHHPNSVKLFLNYVKYVLDNLTGEIDLVVILNEPMVFVGMGYLRGEHPPFYKSPSRAIRAINNLIKIEKKSYQIIKEKSKNILVGNAHLYNFYYPHSKNKFSFKYLLEKLATNISELFRVSYFLNKTKKYQDFIGINYYRKSAIKIGFSKKTIVEFKNMDDPHNPQGWKEFASGIYAVLMRVTQKYRKPIFILENGKPTDLTLDDNERVEFISQNIEQVKRAVTNGADVRGYFHYSLLDSYEWTGGYDYFFGLVQINRKTLEKKKRKSYFAYKKIIEENIIVI